MMLHVVKHGDIQGFFFFFFFIIIIILDMQPQRRWVFAVVPHTICKDLIHAFRKIIL